MTDALTAEERVTLNRLLRKEQEYNARIKTNIDGLCERVFGAGVLPSVTPDSIPGHLVDNADAFVAALKPFCKAKH